MAHETVFKLGVHVDEFLHDVMVVAKRKHLLNKKHQAEIACWLIEMRLNSKLLTVLSTGQSDEIASNVAAFDACHCK